MRYIFNPEHDLCLANGDRNYVPPRSALQFGEDCAEVMHIIEQSDLPQSSLPITPWGWNHTIKRSLIKEGIPEAELPTDLQLDTLRELQHRKTILPLQPHVRVAETLEVVEQLLKEWKQVVLKDPWSGSGRGLRWVSHQMSEHDKHWTQKVIAEHRCVMVEPRLDVACDFALEYYITQREVRFVGYSLFCVENGVYRANVLWQDDKIATRVQLPESQQQQLEEWLTQHVMGKYEGPLGVDFMRAKDGNCYLSEVNFRYTMGLVAHEYLRQHPEHEGCLWGVNYNPSETPQYRIVLQSI